MQSKPRCQRNSVSRVSVLALFNIDTCDLPSSIFRKFAYVTDLALLHSSMTWKSRHDYSFCVFPNLELEIQFLKTAKAAFHLNKRAPKREPKACNSNKLLPFCLIPTYFIVKLNILDHHLVLMRKKISSSVTLLR